MKVTEITAIIGSIVSILQLIFIGVLTFLAYKTNKQHNDFTLWEKKLELKPDIKLMGIYLAEDIKEWAFRRYIVFPKINDKARYEEVCKFYKNSFEHSEKTEYEKLKQKYSVTDYADQFKLKTYIIDKSKAAYLFENPCKVELLKINKMSHILMNFYGYKPNHIYMDNIDTDTKSGLILYGVLKLVFKNTGNSFSDIRIKNVVVSSSLDGVHHLKGDDCELKLDVDKNNLINIYLTIALPDDFSVLTNTPFRLDFYLCKISYNDNLLELKHPSLFLRYNKIVIDFTLTNRYGAWDYNMIIEKKNDKSVPHISIKNIN